MRIFHYTDVGALKSILEHGRLWASDIRYLNDHSEYRDGEKCINDVLRAECANLPEADSAKIQDHFDKYVETSKASYTMICSLSQGQDLLSQWRGYCPRSGGYALEFELENERDFGAPLHQCIYESETKQEKSKSLFDLSKRVIVDRRGDKSKLFQTAWSNIAKFKNSGFSEEREMRLIIFKKANDASVKYRTRDNLIIPYMEVELPYARLKSIWIGPCANTDLAREALTGYLSSLKRVKDHPYATLDVPEIKVSSITYRG